MCYLTVQQFTRYFS